MVVLTCSHFLLMSAWFPSGQAMVCVCMVCVCMSWSTIVVFQHTYDIGCLLVKAFDQIWHAYLMTLLVFCNTKDVNRSTSMFYSVYTDIRTQSKLHVANVIVSKTHPCSVRTIKPTICAYHHCVSLLFDSVKTCCLYPYCYIHTHKYIHAKYIQHRTHDASVYSLKPISLFAPDLES